MEFPIEFFEDEVRDGFFVPAIMKRCWAAQLEVLDVFSKICEKHNIRWFASAGTLLGAVRHGGYIPWDDDIDVHMFRNDYIRFMKIADKELPEGYDVLAMDRDTGWDNSVIRVVNGRQISFIEDRLEKYHEFPYVVGIDITILDYLSPNKEEENFRKQIIEIVNGVALNITDENQDTPEMQGVVAQVESMCGITLDRNSSMRLQLFALADNLYSLYGEDEAKEVAIMYNYLKEGTQIYKKEWFDKTIYLPFENTKVAVPLAYDDDLKVSYRNYMNIIIDGAMHGYPHFKEQEACVKDESGKKLFEYVFSKEDLQRPIVEKVQRERKEIVFLPYRASTWKAIEGLWRAAMEDSAYDVYVVPVPYYERTAVGGYKEEMVYYEGDKYPDYVPITNFNDYIFDERKPDVIITQNPYDDCNCATSVHPFFYAKNLKNFTNKLVHIPYFKMEEIAGTNGKSIYNMRYFVTVPGVVQADKVIVQSEQMRKRYIEVLCDFAGANTKEIWENKIMNSDCIDKYQKTAEAYAGVNVPDEWGDVLLKEDGGLKKILLYHTTVLMFEKSGKNAIDKIKSVLQTFKEKKEEIALIWRPDNITDEVLPIAYPELWENYQEIVNQYKNEGWGIYDNTLSADNIIEVCDAYYGDSSNIANKFRVCAKPVMVQDVSVVAKEDGE